MPRISASTTLSVSRPAVLYRLVPLSATVPVHRCDDGSLESEFAVIGVKVQRIEGDAPAEDLSAARRAALGVLVKYSWLDGNGSATALTGSDTWLMVDLCPSEGNCYDRLGLGFSLYIGNNEVDTAMISFVLDGEKGDKGDKGNRGAVLRGPQAWSDCPVGYAFQSGAEGEQFLDVVIYQDNFYICQTSHIKSSANAPLSSASNNGKLWQVGSKFDLVATKILLAQYALVKNLGVETVEMKDASGNIIFQVKDGNVTCRTGTFENIVFSGVALKKRTQVTAANFSSIFKLQADSDIQYDIDLKQSGTWLDIRYLPGNIIVYPKNMRALCGNVILLYNNTAYVLSIATSTTTSYNGGPGTFGSFSVRPGQFASLECRIGAKDGTEVAYFVAQYGTASTTLDT